MGKTTCTLGTVHGALSQSHWYRITCPIPFRILLGFRLRDSVGHWARNEMSRALLLRQYFRRVGFRAPFCFFRERSGKRSWGNDRALFWSIADAGDCRPGVACVDRILARKSCTEAC